MNNFNVNKILFILVIYFINGCNPQDKNDTEKLIAEFEKYSLSFEPHHIDLDKSLDDRIKPVIDSLNFKDSVTLRKVSNSIDLILLKECLYQFKTADMEYDLMSINPSYSKKLLFAFLTLNGIDSNQIITKYHGNLGFTTGNVYDLIEKRDSIVNVKKTKDILILINKEILRIKR